MKHIVFLFAVLAIALLPFNIVLAQEPVYLEGSASERNVIFEGFLRPT